MCSITCWMRALFTRRRVLWQLLVVAWPKGELVEKGSSICDTLVAPLEVPAEIEFTLYRDRLKLIDRGCRHHTSNLAVGQGEGRPHLASSRLTRRRLFCVWSCSDAPSKSQFGETRTDCSAHRVSGSRSFPADVTSWRGCGLYCRTDVGVGVNSHHRLFYSQPRRRIEYGQLRPPDT